jgi:membrane protein YqaA with SNARE-associated domain
MLEIRHNPRKNGWESLGPVAAFLVAIGITVSIFLLRDQIEQLASYGYAANFVVNLIGSATVVVPAPGFAVVLATGGVLNPVGVGIAAGVGAGLGELTGYLVGWSGGAIIQERPLYQRLRKLMEKYGDLIIFVMALVPNPAFDAGGMVAGAMRMPVWRFLLACCLGKSIRFVLLALGVGLFS